MPLDLGWMYYQLSHGSCSVWAVLVNVRQQQCEPSVRRFWSRSDCIIVQRVQMTLQTVQFRVKIPLKPHYEYLNHIQTAHYTTRGSIWLLRCRSSIIALIIHIRSEWATRDLTYCTQSIKRCMRFPQNDPFIGISPLIQRNVVVRGYNIVI